MITQSDLWKSNPFQFLVERQFPVPAGVSIPPPRLNANPPRVTRTSNGHYLSTSDLIELKEQYNQKKSNFIAELNSLDEESLRTRAKEAYEADLVAAQKRIEAEEAKRVFNQANAMADFEHWARISYWTIDEAVAITLGRDPRAVTWDSVKHFIQFSKFAKDFADRRVILERARGAGHLLKTNLPAFLLGWMD